MDIAVEADEPGRELPADLVDIRDPAGFEHAYERYRLPVYRYLRARVVHDEDALDLTATTFERAFAKRASFHPETAAWGLGCSASHATRRSTRSAGPGVGLPCAPTALMDHLALAGNRDVEARRTVGHPLPRSDRLDPPHRCADDGSEDIPSILGGPWITSRATCPRRTTRRPRQEGQPPPRQPGLRGRGRRDPRPHARHLLRDPELRGAAIPGAAALDGAHVRPGRLRPR